MCVSFVGSLISLMSEIVWMCACYYFCVVPFKEGNLHKHIQMFRLKCTSRTASRHIQKRLNVWGQFLLQLHKSKPTKSYTYIRTLKNTFKGLIWINDDVRVFHFSPKFSDGLWIMWHIWWLLNISRKVSRKFSDNFSKIFKALKCSSQFTKRRRTQSQIMLGRKCLRGQMKFLFTFNKNKLYR